MKKDVTGTLVHMEPYGRLGNRLFLAAHLIGFTSTFNISVLNLGLREYASHFPWFEGNAAGAFPYTETGTKNDYRRIFRNHRVMEILPWSHRFRYWENEDFDFDRKMDKELLANLNKGYSVYLRAWVFRGYESLAKARSKVLDCFLPRGETKKQIVEFIDESRKGSDRLIAVHIRWKDYRTTQFYIDAETYTKRMKKLQQLLPGQNLRFIFFSNEEIPRDFGKGFDCIKSPSHDMIFDLYAMASCDLIIAPPSTFSGWASFYGEVPVATLKREAEELSLSSFAVWKG
ncbi:MAG: hypothetical protein ABSF43_01665 [Rectinemataceae bacterium]